MKSKISTNNLEDEVKTISTKYEYEPNYDEELMKNIRNLFKE